MNKQTAKGYVGSNYVGETRTHAAPFIPYMEPPSSLFRVNGMIFTLDAANSHLRIELDSAGIAETVYVDVDLDCATGTPSIECVGHSP